MDRNSTAVFAQRVTGRAARNIAVIGVVSCLAVVGFAAAVTGAGPALSSRQGARSAGSRDLGSPQLVKDRLGEPKTQVHWRGCRARIATAGGASGSVCGRRFFVRSAGLPLRVAPLAGSCH
jgi:hypothetical protein